MFAATSYPTEAPAIERVYAPDGTLPFARHYYASTDEWHALRRPLIGGSRAAAAAGLNPYRTRRELYAIMRGEASEPDLSEKESVIFGNLLEDVVAQEYARRTGRTVRRDRCVCVSKAHPFMGVSIDRVIVGEDRLLECKTSDKWAFRAEDWGDVATDVVPTVYLLQCQHTLAVTGYPVIDLAVLVGGNELRLYTVYRNETLIAWLIELERAFHDGVVRGVMPPIDTYDEASATFPTSVPRAIEATPEIADLFREFSRAKAAARDAKDVIEGAKKRGVFSTKAAIAEYLGENDTLTIGGEKVLTWRTQSTSRLDDAALKAAHPELYAEFTKSSTSRVMRLKGEAA